MAVASLPSEARALKVRIGCEFQFETDEPSASVFQVEPHRDFAHDVLSASWLSAPEVPSRAYQDAYGNHCRRLVIPEGDLRVRYESVVEIDGGQDPADTTAAQVPPEDLPDDTLQFLLPSRYCLPDMLSAAALDNFGDHEPGWLQVDAISHWVHEHIAYTIGSTDSTSDATTVYLQRQGVCRDYAHLAISFCRALNYPARYACGYIPLMDRPLPEEGMDFNAWMEVYIGNEWVTFDPRNDARLAGRVLIGRGRDAVDVAMVTSSGAPRLVSMTVWTEA